VKVVVVGGGIGGLATALALARKSIDAVVLEQAAAVAAVGASIDIGPNATRLLDELGVDGLRRVGVRPDALEFLRYRDGEVLLHVPHGAAAEAELGSPVLDFYRPDLHRILLDALAPGVVRLYQRYTVPKTVKLTSPTYFYLGRRGAKKASMRKTAKVERAKAGRYTSQVDVTLPASWHGAFRYASCFRGSKGAGMGNPRQRCPRLRLRF